MMLDFTAILSQWQLLLDGAELTAKLALVTTVTGFLIGTLCAIARRSQSRVFARVAAIYVESIRNTPFLVQIFLVYFGLSSMGFSFTAFT
ncbi:TPA: ABC transporter permease subunit, partial [Citrobacter farmeri]